MRQAADYMKCRKDRRSLQPVVPRLLVFILAIDDAERTGGSAQRNCIHLRACERRDVAERPRRREQPALARIELGEADAHVGGIGCPRCAVRVVTAADAARTDAIRGRADERAGGGNLIGQRF